MDVVNDILHISNQDSTPRRYGPHREDPKARPFGYYPVEYQSKCQLNATLGDTKSDIELETVIGGKAPGDRTFPTKDTQQQDHPPAAPL